jgi:hypothetical protein
MLLPVKNTNDSLTDLLRVTRLAGSLLNYAARQPGHVFDEQDFKRQPAFRPIARRTPIRAALAEIIQLAAAERQQLRDAFRYDIKFRRYADRDTFDFKYPHLPAHVQLAGQKLLVAFYDGLSSGFRKLPKQKVDPLSRTSFERLYRQTNARMRLCPACLELLSGPIEDDAGEKKSLVDCDHFLPKSIYAPLAVHPFNLTFICSTCNSRLKRAKDPLNLNADPSAPRRPGMLRESFIPYLRPGLDEIELEFNKHKWVVKVVGKSGVPYADKRAENFDRIFELSQRWSSYLLSFDEMIKDLVLMEGKPITEEQIEEVLKRVVAQYSMWQFREVKAFVFARYAAWLLKNHVPILYREYNNLSEP